MPRFDPLWFIGLLGGNHVPLGMSGPGTSAATEAPVPAVVTTDDFTCGQDHCYPANEAHVRTLTLADLETPQGAQYWYPDGAVTGPTVADLDPAPDYVTIGLAWPDLFWFGYEGQEDGTQECHVYNPYGLGLETICGDLWYKPPAGSVDVSVVGVHASWDSYPTAPDFNYDTETLPHAFVNTRPADANEPGGYSTAIHKEPAGEDRVSPAPGHYTTNRPMPYGISLGNTGYVIPSTPTYTGDPDNVASAFLWPWSSVQSAVATMQASGGPWYAVTRYSGASGPLAFRLGIRLFWLTESAEEPTDSPLMLVV